MSRRKKGASKMGMLARGQYTDEEWQFLQAIHQYKRDNQRPFPTWSEVLAVVLACGYRLVAEPTALPVYRPERDE